MLLILYVFVILTGLVMGSFLTAFTYRLVKGEDFMNGRSRCVYCKKDIRWFDNIPLFSFLMLDGKCRNCSKNISTRYPIIEASTALILFAVLKQSLFEGRDISEILYLFIVSILLMAILIIDLEHQIIPDQLVFILIGLTFMFLLINNPGLIYINLLTGFLLALFLLTLNLATGGRGMGLGDVKLAIFMGLFFGYPVGISWMFSSFIMGAVVGIILIMNKKAKFGKHIAFGPFMVVSFFVNLLWSSAITGFLIPYL